MARVVKVDLLLEAASFKRGAREAKRETKGVAEALDDAAKSGAKTSRALDETAKEMSDAARAAAALDRRVDELRESLRDLAVQSALGTGGADLDKQMRAQEAALRKAMKARKLLPDDKKVLPDEGEAHKEAVRFGGRIAEGIASGLSRAGGPISAALSNVFGALPPQAQVAIGAGVVAAAAAAAPVIGAVISGAVVGAAGAGGIVGGIAIAAKHPQVQAAAKLTGAALTQELQRAAVAFVPATVESLGIVRAEIGSIGDELERAFSAAAPMLGPLTRDVLAGAEDAVEGFATAVERSGPVVEQLGQIAIEAGDLIGDTFEQLSDHAVEGARALGLLWQVFELGVRGLVDTITGLTIVFGLMEKLGASLAGDPARVAELAAAEEAARQSGSGLSENLEELISGFGQTGEKAGTAAVEVESLNAAIKRMAGENISAEQAQMRLEEAIDRATAAGARNNDGIDRNTAKGRANRALLVSLAEASNTSAEAIYQQTHSQELASEATEQGRAAFMRSAAAMGVSKAEAKRLADQLFGIPKKVDSKIMVTANTQPALDSARSIVARINNMHARINVHAEPSGGYGGSAHTGDGYSTGMRWGGAFEHARDGLIGLRDAGIYSPAGPARYAFAEPATGGEAFIPRFGNRDRSLDILATAARWYGMQVGPTAGTAAPAQPAGHSPAQLAAAVRAALVGVSVQMDGRTVGVIQGRQADIYGRGA